MTLTVSDEPPDRPEWVAETIRLVTDATAAARGDLLARIARASEGELAAGSDDRWGLGQVAVHLLLIERGVATIALQLARGGAPGHTGQPRPAASGITREGIASLAAKAAAAVQMLRSDFPSSPDLAAQARHPYYGQLNAVAWLLTLPNHYRAHLEAFDRGTKSAL